MQTLPLIENGPYFKEKFHLYDVNYKHLENIDENKIKEIQELIKRKKEFIGTTKNRDQLDLYYSVMRYISNPKIYLDLKTHDEKVIFLILYLDPELKALKTYLASNLHYYLISHDIKDEKQKEEYRTKSNELKRKIREQLGFFDKELVKYEVDYFLKFLKTKVLITEYNGNIDPLFDLVLKKCKGKELPNIDLERLLNQVEEYKLKYGKVNYKTIMYQIIRQPKLLGLKTFHEELIFFILNIDPNLEMYRIYEEESNWNIVEERIKGIFGFFNKELILYERKISKLLYPEEKFEF